MDAVTVSFPPSRCIDVVITGENEVVVTTGDCEAEELGLSSSSSWSMPSTTGSQRLCISESRAPNAIVVNNHNRRCIFLAYNTETTQDAQIKQSKTHRRLHTHKGKRREGKGIV